MAHSLKKKYSVERDLEMIGDKSRRQGSYRIMLIISKNYREKKNLLEFLEIKNIPRSQNSPHDIDRLYSVKET